MFYLWVIVMVIIWIIFWLALKNIQTEDLREYRVLFAILASIMLGWLFFMIFNKNLGYKPEHEQRVSSILYHVFYLIVSVAGVYFACVQIDKVFKDNKSRPDLLV